jgi:hypothetical protein
MHKYDFLANRLPDLIGELFAQVHRYFPLSEGIGGIGQTVKRF